MHKKILWSSVVLCGLGLCLALISLYPNKVTQWGLAAESFCNINAFINCDLVQASSYSKLFGVPVAAVGLLFYLWVGALVALALLTGEEGRSHLPWVWLGSLFALLYSGYLAWISFAVLQALCPVCSGMYLVNLLLFVVLGLAARLVRFHFTFKKLAMPVLLGIAIFGLGGIIFSAQASNQAGISKKDLKTIVQLHFRQSEYQMELPPARPVWGNPDAPVVVVEFSDFQCPACRHFANTVKPALNELRNQIQFYYLHYPLDPSCNPQFKSGGHPFACAAAKAAVCASAHGDFWGFHDELFRDQPKISPAMIDALVTKRGWNLDTFKNCLESEATAKTVQEDIALAEKLNIGGTPTVFVGNRRVKYWAYPEVLRGIVRQALRR